MKYFILSSLALCLMAPAYASAQVTPVNAAAKAPAFIALAPIAAREFQAAQNGQVIWQNALNYKDLITALEGLEAHGLTPEDYHLSVLKAAQNNPTARDQIATDAWFGAAAHMLNGKLSPLTVEPDWTAASRKADLSAALTQALATGTIANSLTQFAPKQPGYAALLAEYAVLMSEAEKPHTVISAGETLKLAMKGPRVTLLQSRLIELGYLTAETQTGIMDAETIAAIKAFQTAADLDDDGAVGPATLSALNRGVEGKINQVRVNLERWRWLPDDLGRRHLRANIAGFNVTAWKNSAPVKTYLTIVGKPFRKTPVFSDEIEYIVFNPWWETPYSLATKDKLPLFRKDPSAVARLGFDVLDKSGTKVDATLIDWNTVPASNFPYRLRQNPGDQNALGKVKIMFPNVHNVYLHDTPTRGLFAQRQRAFSSGCMRTQNPLDLSEWLLGETPNWTRDKMDAAVVSGKETRAVLSQKVPVHVLYFTAVNEGGAGIRYLDDIYDRDAAVLAGLRTPPIPR